MATHSSILASCGQRSLVGCCPQGRTESDTTEATQHACRHWRRKWQPTPVFLPGESQGQRSLVGCCPQGRTESDTTEATQQQQHQFSKALNQITHSFNSKLFINCYSEAFLRNFLQVTPFLDLNLLTLKTNVLVYNSRCTGSLQH